MNIQHMKYAVEIARTGSINKASRRLLVAQPNLSRHLKQLEAELGFKLFVVQNRRIHLTRAGMHFLDNASSLEKKFNKMVGECRELAASEGVPLCDCGGIIKPDVVLYEEALPEDTVMQALDDIRHGSVVLFEKQVFQIDFV